MKRFIIPVTTIALLAVVFISLHSCKKGDGDPFISFLSRKARLTGEWKVSTLSSTFKYNNKTTETTYDGSNKTVVFTVKDSTTADTVFTYVTTDKSTGDITMDFKKDGNYSYSETFQNTLSGNVTNIEINGNWYFMGGNIQNKYKNKELLALQVKDYINNPYMGDDYSITYQGTNSLDILEIYELKNKEIILKEDKTETIDFVKYTTTMQYTLIPR